MTASLETERLVLRRFTPDDLEALVELDADPLVMHYVTGGIPTSRAEIENDVLPAFLAYDEHPGWGFWAAEEKASTGFVGWFHLRPTEESPLGEVELGYRLRRGMWGSGYATEGSRALVEMAFREHDVERIVAYTMAVHVASRRVLEKSGLRLVRCFETSWPYPIPGDEEGDVEYALLRSEWDADRRG